MDAVKVENVGQYFESNVSAQDIADAIEFLKNSYWHPVNCEPPQDGEYLIFTKFDDDSCRTNYIRQATWYSEGFWDVDSNTRENITHWMIKPKSPLE